MIDLSHIIENINAVSRPGDEPVTEESLVGLDTFTKLASAGRIYNERVGKLSAIRGNTPTVPQPAVDPIRPLKLVEGPAVARPSPTRRLAAICDIALAKVQSPHLSFPKPSATEMVLLKSPELFSRQTIKTEDVFEDREVVGSFVRDDGGQLKQLIQRVPVGKKSTTVITSNPYSKISEGLGIPERKAYQKNFMQGLRLHNLHVMLAIAPSPYKKGFAALLELQTTTDPGATTLIYRAAKQDIKYAQDYYLKELGESL